MTESARPSWPVNLGALVAAGLAAGSAFLLGVTAWPEIVVPAYFVSKGWRLYSAIFFPHTPLLIGTTALLGSVFGLGPGLLRALAGLPLGLCVLLVVVSASRAGKTRTGLFASSLLAGAPAVVLWAVYFEGPAVWPEPFLAPLVLGAALLLERYERCGRSGALVEAGLLLGAAILVKQTSAWFALGALAWICLRSRRRSPSAFLLLAGAAVLPYVVFVLSWGAAFGTLDHLRWTFLVPLAGRHAAEIGVPAGLEDLREAVAPFLVFPALGLLASVLPGRHVRSPAAWLAVGAFGMAWPRWDLLHLSGSLGLIALAVSRAVAVSVPALRRLLLAAATGGDVPGYGRGRLARTAAGTGLLAVHLAVLLLGGGFLAAGSAGDPVRFWNDSVSRQTTAAVAGLVPPGGALLVFNARYENTYPLTGTRPPADFYVNPAFWYYLNKYGIDRRLVDALRADPSVPILFREAEPGVDEAGFRSTAVYRYVTRETRVTGEAPSGAEWRAAR